MCAALVLVLAGAAHGATRHVRVSDEIPRTSNEGIWTIAPGPTGTTCPTRPRFTAVIDADGGTSFSYRARTGQIIVGARGLGVQRVRAMLRTTAGRARLPRIEMTTDRAVDARRLPWFAERTGPHRIVMAILANADGSGYSGVRIGYTPRMGTSAKLILPPGAVRTTLPGCPRVTGYPPIYARNIARAAGVRASAPSGSVATTADGTAKRVTAPVDRGPAFRLTLALPRDQAAPPGAVAAIRHEAEVVTDWFAGQSANGARPRWIRDRSGRIDVRIVDLPRSTAEYNGGTQGPVLQDVKAASRPVAGLVVDVVWIAAGVPQIHPCGVATSSSVGNGPFLPTGAVLWQTACDVTPSIDSAWPDGGTYLLAHEMAHLFGAVQACAPHYDGTGHVVGSPTDILNEDGLDWQHLVLDPGYDDYLYTGNACDIARSPMWTVAPIRPAG